MDIGYWILDSIGCIDSMDTIDSSTVVQSARAAKADVMDDYRWHGMLRVESIAA
jgi:hypothetical protein